MKWLWRRGIAAPWLIFWLCVPLPVVGVMSHELGHLAVARWFGYETRLHYAALSFYGAHEAYVGRCGPLPTTEAAGRAYSVCRQRAEDRDNLLILLGGPVLTMLTGTIGLIWLLRARRKRAASDPPGRSEWAAALLALFWGRQVWNQTWSGLRWLGGAAAVPAGGDEAAIAALLSLPDWSLSAPTALLGLIVCLMVVGYRVPYPLRRSLLIGGVAGSGLGFALWMGALGPALLP